LTCAGASPVDGRGSEPSDVLFGFDGPAPTKPAPDAAQAADDDALALALGMRPVMPELPANFRERVLAAHAGDLDAIRETRAIGDAIPAHMQVAFAEMVEGLLGSE
jgi:hypothetical protein